MTWPTCPQSIQIRSIPESRWLPIRLIVESWKSLHPPNAVFLTRFTERLVIDRYIFGAASNANTLFIPSTFHIQCISKISRACAQEALVVAAVTYVGIQLAISVGFLALVTRLADEWVGWFPWFGDEGFWGSGDCGNILGLEEGSNRFDIRGWNPS